MNIDAWSLKYEGPIFYCLGFMYPHWFAKMFTAIVCITFLTVYTKRALFIKCIRRIASSCVCTCSKTSCLFRNVLYMLFICWQPLIQKLMRCLYCLPVCFNKMFLNLNLKSSTVIMLHLSDNLISISSSGPSSGTLWWYQYILLWCLPSLS